MDEISIVFAPSPTPLPLLPFFLFPYSRLPYVVLFLDNVYLPF